MVDEAGNLRWATASGTVSAFTDLSDVTITSALAGQVVYFNGSQWINTATGTLGLLGSSTIGTYIQSYDSDLIHCWSGPYRLQQFVPGRQRY